MPSRYSNVNSRRNRAHKHGTERSEFYDVGQIIAANKAGQKVRGTNRSQCQRCGKYFTKEERELHFECPILQPPKQKPKAPLAPRPLTLNIAKGESKKKSERLQMPLRIKLDNPMSTLTIIMVIKSNGATRDVRFEWFCNSKDEHLIFSDEGLLESLVTRLKRYRNPTVVSVSACRKRTGKTYQLGSSDLAELFKQKEKNA